MLALRGVLPRGCVRFTFAVQQRYLAASQRQKQGEPHTPLLNKDLLSNDFKELKVITQDGDQARPSQDKVSPSTKYVYAGYSFPNRSVGTSRGCWNGPGARWTPGRSSGMQATRLSQGLCLAPLLPLTLSRSNSKRIRS